MSKAILLTSGRDKRIERVQKNRLSQKIMRVSNEMNQNGFYKGKKSQTNSDYIDGFMPKKHFNLGLGQQIIHIERVWVFYKNHWNFVKSAFDAFMYFDY